MTTKDRILARLIAAEGSFVSGEGLAKEFGVSRNSVCKNVQKLREEGCSIEAVSNRGYRLIALTDQLREAEIRGALRTSVLGRDLVLCTEVPSTNQLARSLAEQGAPAGTVVAADIIAFAACSLVGKLSKVGK